MLIPPPTSSDDGVSFHGRAERKCTVKRINGMPHPWQLLVVGIILLIVVGCQSSTVSPISPPTSSTAPPLAPTTVPVTPTISPSDCQACHQDIFTNWKSGAHANTQADVARELGSDRAGQTPGD